MDQLMDSKKIPKININDIFHDLNDENLRLRNDLLVANKCNNILHKFKHYLDKIVIKCKCFDETKYELQLIYNEFNEFIKDKQKSQQMSTHLLISNSFIGDKLIEENNNLIKNKNKFNNKLITNKIIDNKSQTFLESMNTRKSYYIKNLHKKRHKCSWIGCHFGTNKKTILNDHMNIHKGIRPYSCPETDCGKTFFSDKSLSAHRKRHLPTGSYKCLWPDCQFRGRTMDIVRSHLKLRHTDEEVLNCSQCELHFDSNHDLSIHLESHLEAKYKCEWPACHYKSNQLSKLNIHFRTHTGEKPFACEWPGCESRFTRKDILKEHMMRHNELRPYECQWPGCDAKFVTQYELKYHSNYHTKEKQLSCDWPGCEFRASKKIALKHHKIKHTGEHLICGWPQCGKKFALKTTLENHLKLHENPLRCDWPGCEKTFTLNSSFKYHIRSHQKHLNNVIT